MHVISPHGAATQATASAVGPGPSHPVRLDREAAQHLAAGTRVRGGDRVERTPGKAHLRREMAARPPPRSPAG
eukprot:9658953-Lingulodinium_polyedra.AAC.1